MTLKQHIIAFLTKNDSKERPQKKKKKAEEKKEQERAVPKECLGIKEQELEFEESRQLLQTDLFHTLGEEQDNYFPQFEHLLTQPETKRPKSVTQSLRRKLSFSGRLKRAISTPDFSKRKQSHTPPSI
ncbi:hypothetical protein G6F56_013408 [Rhizopus delemar]|nr:hypothetical protein G6F56_013408 [Rhizopus delemar]